MQAGFILHADKFLYRQFLDSVFLRIAYQKVNSVNNQEVYKEIVLDDNRTVRIIDSSKNYFGDYHLVKLDISCELPLSPAQAQGNSPDAESSVPVYRRTLEKMAVPSAEVEQVKSLLLAEFMRNALPYLARPDFSAKLLAGERARKQGPQSRYASRI
jgi:hypothetical protein